MTVWNVWEVTRGLRERAAASGLPVIDLGQGNPTDPTPGVVRDALAAASDAPGYPPAHGTAALRDAYSAWARRRLGAEVDPDHVVATVGSKEFIATVPWLLGLSREDLVVVPELGYPTYRAGADLAGCRVLAADSLTALGPERPRLIWVNTPGNPTGQVLPAEHLAKVVAWARERDCLVLSDECYLELTAPGSRAPSILSPEVTSGDYANILAVHSLSKRSDMAGYRCGFITGDPAVTARLLRRRRDAGLIVPTPVQAAAAAALADDEYVAQVRRRYAARRSLLTAALREVGFQVDHSEAGMFVWATRDEADTATATALADRGIVVAPGGFYGPTGSRHVRLSVTVPEDELAEVGRRLGAGGG